MTRSPRPAPDIVVLNRHGAGAVADGELVRRAKAGESWPHEVIYRRYAGLIAATARRLLRDPGEVDDIVHETFLTAFEQMDQLEDGDALRGWLARIAVSRIHRRFRRLKFIAFFVGEDPTARLEEQASADASPEQRAELALLDRALAELPMKLRAPWVLRNVVGYPLEEVAAACECSLATVKRRIADADGVMRNHLGIGGEA